MDFSLIEDEKFDFDLPFSPDVVEGQDREDDDEIFFGPVGHKERCVATNADVQSTKILEHMQELKPMSPLNAEQIVEIFKEATSVAYMFKSNSTTDDIHQLSNDIPELIKDSREKAPNKNSDGEKENEISGLGLDSDITINYKQYSVQENKTELHLTEGEPEEENYVVRRRALKERNTRPIDTASQASLVLKSEANKTKTAIQRPGMYTKRESQLKKPNVTTKRHNSDESSMSSTTLTPRKTSTSSFRDRSFSSTRSSSASDTSFTEDSKTSKLPVVSRSGLKLPGFTGRRRTSSNSSVSSTSSTSSIPGFNPNETFTISKTTAPPKEPTKVKKPVSQARQVPANKASLTKIGKGLTKPTFAKPNEVSKPKLQPMKALPRVAALGGARSASVSGPRSPVRAAVSRRAASAGTTPGQTPGQGVTPSNGTKPKRRSMALSSAGTGSRTPIRRNEAEGTVQGNAPKSPNPSTPRYGRRSTTGLPGSVGVSKGNVGANPIEKRRISGLVPPKDTSKKRVQPAKGDSTSSVPATATPPNAEVKHGSKRKSMSASCNRRRSFLPTPNLSQSQVQFQIQPRSRLNTSVASASMSPVQFKLSPAVTSNPTKQPNPSTSSCECTDDPAPLELSLTFTIESEEAAETKPALCESSENSEILPAFSPIHEPQTPPQAGNKVDNTGSCCETVAQENSQVDVAHEETFELQTKSSLEVVVVTHELISGVSQPLLHGSPLMKQVCEDELIDPFSPGLVSPDLPQEGCLNPVVLQTKDSADLIDLSHETPKRAAEVDLIDLSAESPVSSQEGKLVDI